MYHLTNRIYKDHWRGYLELGLIPYPASRTGKGPIVAWSKDLPPPCMDDYSEWEEKHPDANVWVLLGDEYVVIDPDNQEAEDFIRSLSLPDGPISNSGKKSVHRWFRTSIALQQIKIKPNGNHNINLEVRTGHNGMLVPPSIHPETKRQYAWQAGHSPWDIDFPEFPIEAYDKIRALGDREKSQPGHRDPCWHEKLLNGVSEGTRNDSLTRLAGRYIQKGLSKDEILPILLEANRKYDPPLEEKEVEKILDSVLRTDSRKHPIQNSNEKIVSQSKGSMSSSKIELDIDPAVAESLLSYNCTDDGNAESFRLLFGEKYTFVDERRKWFSFNGIRWVEDDQGAIQAMKETVKIRGTVAWCLADGDEKRNITKWAVASQSWAKIKAALNMAQSDLWQHYNVFDKDSMLLCCKHGVIDLRTGEFRNATQGDRLHKSTNIEFDSKATCPRWEEFLKEVFLGDQEMTAYVKRAIGYTLTGKTSEQCVFILYGTGANGKSVFLGTMEKLLGDYAITTPASTFKEIQNQTNSNDVARMAGARMVKCIEVKEGAILNEERIKSLTGSDRISARFLYGEYFEFQPSCKIWIATNNKPRIFGTDNAIWRRIRLIPFQVTFPPEKQDKELLDKLADELPGILAWAVEGCLEWQKVGLEPPEGIKKEIALYREESNPLVPFLEEETIAASDGKIKASDFYQRYKCWCQKRGEHSLSDTQFGRRLSEIGYQKKKNSHIYYLGIKLKTPS